MGACMSSGHKGKHQSIIRVKQPFVSHEQSLLLDLWSERHISLLKAHFAAGLTSNKKTENVLDYQAFVRVIFDGQKRSEVQQRAWDGFDEKTKRAAFRMFDRSKTDRIDFKEFCLGLAIICLGGTHQKVRFIFDLFDQNRDHYLDKKEQMNMLKAAAQIVVSVNHGEAVRTQWINHQIAQLSLASDRIPQARDSHIDFYLFNEWATNNLNVYAFLEVFEIVASPSKEHDLIFEILQKYERQHGDTMYALSFRWWDSWKEHVMSHRSVAEKDQYIAQVRQSIDIDASMPDSLKQHILNQCKEDPDNAFGTNENEINRVFKGKQWTDLGYTEPEKQQPKLKRTERSPLIAYKTMTKMQQNLLENSDSMVLAGESPLITGTGKMAKSPNLTFTSKFRTMYQNGQLTKPDSAGIKKDTGLGLIQSASLRRASPGANKRHQHTRSFLQDIRTDKGDLMLAQKKDSLPPIAPKRILQQPRKTEGDLQLTSSASDIQQEENLRTSQKNLRKVPMRLQEVTSSANFKKREFNSMLADTDSQHAQRNWTVNSVIEESVADSECCLLDVDQSWLIQRSGTVWNFAQTALAERPSSIDNSDIQGEDHSAQLHKNLIMYRDFVMIPEHAWNYLVKWYGGGRPFPRKVLIHNLVPSLELYPPRINCLLADREGKSVQDSQRSIFVSSAMEVNEIHLKICESFNYISCKDTRLWVKGQASVHSSLASARKSITNIPDTINFVDESGSQWICISSPDAIQKKAQTDFIVKEGDFFMVEVKFHTDKWPILSDEISKQKNWRNFEVGEKVDYYEQETREWMIAKIVKCNKNSVRLQIQNQSTNSDRPVELTIFKDSKFLDKFGEHTMNLIHYKNETSMLEQQQFGDVFGLVNIGNTCYMNSVLQALLHTPLLAEYFRTAAYDVHFQDQKEKNQEKVATPKLKVTEPVHKDETVDFMNLSMAFSQMANLEPQTTSHQPSSFKRVVNEELPLFYGNQQQDAAEFLNFLLDKMNEDLNRVETLKKVEDSTPKSQTPSKTEPTANVVFKHDDGGSGGTSIIPDNPLHAYKDEPSDVEDQEKQDKLEGFGLLVKREQDRREREKTKDRRKAEQRNAILKAKEDLYNDFFQASQASIVSSLKVANQSYNNPALKQLSEAKSTFRSVEKNSAEKMEQDFNQTQAVTLDPNISELQIRAQEDWFNEIKKVNSPISDLFLGQQTMSVKCTKCKQMSYNFENWYSLPVPLPYNSKTIFYVHVVWRSSPTQIAPIQAFGIQIEKKAQLNQLMLQIDQRAKLSQKSSKFVLCEIGNGRIYRTLEDNTAPMAMLCKRTNELHLFEQSPEGSVARKKAPGPRDVLRKRSDPNWKPFNFEEIEPGTVIDCFDKEGRWHTAISLGRGYDAGERQNFMKVHFYSQERQWDEWIAEIPQNLKRIASQGSFVNEPPERYWQAPVMQRRIVYSTERKRTETQVMGQPYIVSFSGNFTWQDLYDEVASQVMRHVKVVGAEEENCQVEDSFRAQRPKTLEKNQMPSMTSSMLKRHGQLDPLQPTDQLPQDIHQPELNFKQQVLNIRDDKLPFEIKIFDAETHECIFCRFQRKMVGQEKIIKSQSCECAVDKDSQQKIIFMLDFYKKIEFYIDWIDTGSSAPSRGAENRRYSKKNNLEKNLGTYKDAQIEYDAQTYLKYKQQEKEVLNGVPLATCLDLYKKKEKLDDYDCETCQEKTTAILQQGVSKLPDILVLHLKRFHFQLDFLDKIEDLVTFPIRNLDMTKYLINTSSQKTKQNPSYDLYAIVNHHMFQTQGGHYTAFIQKCADMQEPSWILANDTKISGASPSHLIQKDAYLLFYKRKELTPSNILKLTAEMSH